MAKSFPGGVPKLIYFDFAPFGGLAGRGGAVRFNFLRHDLNYTEELVPWGGSKVTEAENPTGELPVVLIGNLALSEHHAILRYIDRKLGFYGTDLVRDYYVDRVASATTPWRDTLIASLLDPTTTEKFLAKRSTFYKTLNKHIELAAGTGAFTVGGAASFADDILFAVVFDDTLKYGADILDDYPAIKSFYEAYKQYPGVAAWISRGAT